MEHLRWGLSDGASQMGPLRWGISDGASQMERFRWGLSAPEFGGAGGG